MMKKGNNSTKPKKRSGSKQHATELIVIGGRNALAAVLSSDSQRVKRLLLSQGAQSWLRENVSEHYWEHISLSIGTKDELEEELPDFAHQGCVAWVTPKPTGDFNALLSRLKQSTVAAFLLIVDGVTDPHNLGAIIRVAECFGATGILIRQARSASLSATVLKTSAGASERIDVYEVSNLATALEKLKKVGFWTVASDCSASSEALLSFKFPERTALILGSEGAGVQRILLEGADFRVYIPMSGEVGSLNVAQAAAVFSWARLASLEKPL
jgi:23S rRNA (guanosine2251-2'-O)-methyltransferase